MYSTSVKHDPREHGTSAIAANHLALTRQCMQSLVRAYARPLPRFDREMTANSKATNGLRAQSLQFMPPFFWVDLLFCSTLVNLPQTLLEGDGTRLFFSRKCQAQGRLSFINEQ